MQRAQGVGPWPGALQERLYLTHRHVAANWPGTPSHRRCHECYAYICRQCLFQRTGWACALCGTLNEYSSVGNQRFVPLWQGATKLTKPLPC